ncbi:MAG: zinc ribbon domain-containing protein [Coriobacteriia bacterium]|nr:zinc ribbon domain-containing protein [Coriobacteriia bacterium]
MSVFDKAGGLISRGVDSADRAGKIVKKKAQLAEVSRKQKEAFSQLGIALYAKTKSNPDLRSGNETLFSHVEDLMEQTATLQKEIADIENAGAVPAASTGNSIDCPLCKKSVSYDFKMCPFCGTGLDEVKEALSKCASCSSVSAKNSKFCTSCGASMETKSDTDKTDEATIVNDEPIQETESAPVIPLSTESSEGEVSSSPVCSNCSALLAGGNNFCTACGTKVEVAK